MNTTTRACLRIVHAAVVFSLLLWLFPARMSGQVLQGKIYTLGESGDTVAVYMARLQWKNSTVGAITGTDGSYRLPFANTDTLIVSYSFYKPDTIVIDRNERRRNMLINATQPLKEVVVRQRRPKYVRKGNPAIALIQNVIKHKDENRIEAAAAYKSSSYKKLVLSFGRFNMDFQKNDINRSLSFLEKYIDTIPSDSIPVLTISLRERLTENYYQRSPRKMVHYVKATRMQGADEVMDSEGLGTNLDAIFSEVNIFDNDIELMLNRFVSPLSSTLATTYYHYFITDTVQVDSSTCIELTFTPVNSQSFGFTGRLYIMQDSTYALKKYSINVPYNINLNFVNQLVIEEEFAQTDSGYWAPKESHTYAKFSLFKRKKTRHLYAHQGTFWYQYEMGTQMPDSFAAYVSGQEIVAPDAKKYRIRQWTTMRPIPLTTKEVFLDSLAAELRQLTFFKVLEKTADILGSGYIATAKKRKESFFDIGPVYSLVSYNPVEGVRVRVGGMTTANLNKRWFMSGYLALGFRDLRKKYDLTLTHSFIPKKYHANESPTHELVFNTSYDLEMPGQQFTYMDRDNLLMSYDYDTLAPAAQYVRRAKLRYRKEWPFRLRLDTWLQYENNEATGSLAYWRVNEDGSFSRVKDFNNMELGVKIRWTPGARSYDSQMGEKRTSKFTKDALTLSLSHTVGLMDRRFWYNRTDLSVEKRIWMSAFGHIDATLQGGIVWNAVPYPKLYVPPHNQSRFLTPNTFNLMKPMEFLFDKYVALFATYHLKGLIFNRIPLWNRLNFREVVSFGGIYGGLSAKNIPSPSSPGLYLFPDGCAQLGKMPYMEITAGIENILDVLRIDYVRRISHAKELKGWAKNGIRISLNFSF